MGLGCSVEDKLSLVYVCPPALYLCSSVTKDVGHDLQALSCVYLKCLDVQTSGYGFERPSLIFMGNSLLLTEGYKLGEESSVGPRAGSLFFSLDS